MTKTVFERGCEKYTRSLVQPIGAEERKLTLITDCALTGNSTRSASIICHWNPLTFVDIVKRALVDLLYETHAIINSCRQPTYYSTR
jgi:hypothetical protein